MPEAEWCAAMGLTRELVREYRLANLTEGEHFEKKAGRIGLTAAGVGFLEDAFDLPAKKEGPAELEVVELVAAKKCRCLNKRILLCEFEGRPVRVRVRSSEKFVPGMKVPARRIPGGAEDLWEFAGKRLPRGKGRY